MRCTVASSSLLALLLCAEMYQWYHGGITGVLGKKQKSSKKTTTKITMTVPRRPAVSQGSFAPPVCCESPWKFDAKSGQCILDMEVQGVRNEDMSRLCTDLGFEKEGKVCIRYVRLTYKYEQNSDAEMTA